jgi:hypothetical protein
MADDADVQANEITLDDFNADEQESPKAESSPAEDKTPDVVEKPKETKEEVKADDTATDTEESEATETDGDQEEADETETPQGEDKTLKPKSENRFQNLANENRELRQKVEQLTSQVYQPATEDELTETVNPETGENFNRLEAKFEAYRQQQELDKYNSQVVGSQMEIGNEAYAVISDFPQFNPDDKENFDEELATEAADLLEANLIRDPNVPEIDPQTANPTGKGLIIGSNISPYKLYKTLARASGISATKAQIKGQEATEKMLANADTAGSVSPPKAKVDPLMALWKSDD